VSRKSRRYKKEPKNKPPQLVGGTRTRRKVLTLICTLSLAVFTILGGIFYLLPNVNIVPASGYERADDPMEVALSLTNNGYLHIRPFKVVAFVYDWRAIYDQPENNNQIANVGYDYLGGGTISHLQTVDFTPKPPFGRNPKSKVASADFLVIIQYYQWGWHWPLEKRVRSKVKRGRDDLWMWYRPYLTEIDKSLKLDQLTHVFDTRQLPSEDNRQP
jgi:hypothetical protein